MIGAVGLTVVTAAIGQPLDWAMRGVTPAGVLLIAVVLMDLGAAHRDRLLLPLSGLLCVLSIVFLTRIDPSLAAHQLIVTVIGVFLMVALYFLMEDIRSLARFKYLAGLSAIALLAATMLWGKEINGARLWLSIPHLVTLQSMEVAKILMAIFLAGYVADYRHILRRNSRGRGSIQTPSLRALAPLLLIVIFCLAIFVGQRDLGTTILFFGLFVIMFYLATGQPAYAIEAVVLFAVGLALVYQLFPIASVRVSSWLNPWADPTGIGYQPLQALFCLSEGGIFGVGLGYLSVAKLPAAATDLILAVIGQDLGLIGSLGVVIIYALISVRGYSLAWQATDRFASLLAVALATVFALQTLIIMGGLLRLIPLTSLATPFLSYGGTSIIINFLAIGLLLMVSRDCVPQPEKAR